MKTEESVEKTTLQKVSEKLLAAQQEIDGLALQLALGKADAKDKFEEIKKEFRLQVTEFKNVLETVSESAVSPEVRARIEELEIQLALGTADSKDIFEAQKSKIESAIGKLEEEIKLKWKSMRTPHFIAHEAEKFKLKLEILRLRFGLKKFEVKEDYHARMADVRKEIERMTSGTKSKLNEGKERYDDFKDEVSLAFKHIKKAVESLK